MKVQKTAATVKEEGLEKLYMKARAHFGTVKKKPKPRQPSSKGEPTSSTSVSRGAARAGHNDTEVAMSFMIKQSDRDQLQHSKLNTKFTVVASRVTVHDGGVRVERVALGDLLDVEE